MRAKKQLKKDFEKMERGELGYSEAQKAAVMGRANTALQAQQANQSAELTRMGAAEGLGSRAGAFTNIAGQQAQANQAALANVAASTEATSSQLAEQQRRDIIARNDAQAAATKAMWNRQGDISMKTTQGTGGSMETAAEQDETKRHNTSMEDKADIDSLPA